MNVNNMKRHLGKLKNTDTRCVVVFLQLPERPTHSLIIPVDGLPPRVEQALMDVVESREGQAAPTLAFVLERRVFPDTGKNMLVALHQAGLLRDVPVEQVIMLPRPNQPIPLPDIIAQMGGVVPVTPPDVASAIEEKFNQHTENSRAQTLEDRQNIASNLLRQANDLDAEANRKRNDAYRIAPELRALVDTKEVAIEVETVEKTMKEPTKRAKAKENNA